MDPCIHAWFIKMCVNSMLNFTQGSSVASLTTTVVPSVRVLALSDMESSLDVVINLIKCFPYLEILHMEVAL
jgi:hypothetical protein